MRYVFGLLVFFCACTSEEKRTTCDELFCETYTHTSGIKHGLATIIHKRDSWIQKKRTYVCANIVGSDTLYCYADTSFSKSGDRMGIRYVMNNEFVTVRVLDSSYIYKESDGKPIY